MSFVTSSPTGWNGPSDVLDHATSEIASPREIKHSVGLDGTHGGLSHGQDSKLGIDATKKIGEGFKREWPLLIKMDEAVKAKVEKLFNP